MFENKDKFKLELDNHKFNLQCMKINDILVDSSYFLRVYKFRKIFRHLSLKNPKKQTVVRQLSSCIHEKFNGFNIISNEHSKKSRKKFKPIDIIFKPVEKPNAEIKCYYSQDLLKACRNTCNKGKKLSHGFGNQCYDCGKLFARSDKQKQHRTLLWCSGHCLQF